MTHGAGTLDLAYGDGAAPPCRWTITGCCGGLTGPDLTASNYAESRASPWSLPHARLERMVHLQSPSLPRPGSSWLHVRATGSRPDRTELAGFRPVCQFPADTLDARAAWWGQVYVLDGSRRGGVFLSADAFKSSLVATRCLATFFSGSTGHDGSDALFARLEYELKDPEALEHAAASARAAFATFKADLDAFEDSPQRRK